MVCKIQCKTEEEQIPAFNLSPHTAVKDYVWCKQKSKGKKTALAFSKFFLCKKINKPAAAKIGNYSGQFIDKAAQNIVISKAEKIAYAVQCIQHIHIPGRIVKEKVSAVQIFKPKLVGVSAPGFKAVHIIGEIVILQAKENPYAHCGNNRQQQKGFGYSVFGVLFNMAEQKHTKGRIYSRN